MAWLARPCATRRSTSNSREVSAASAAPSPEPRAVMSTSTTSGSTTDPPPATSRMACCSSAGRPTLSFKRYPRRLVAPTKSSSATAVSTYWLSRRTPTVDRCAKSFRTTCSPSSEYVGGIRISDTTTSTCSRATRASRPSRSDPSPTTLMSGASPRISMIPRAKIALSSPTATRSTGAASCERNVMDDTLSRGPRGTAAGACGGFRVSARVRHPFDPPLTGDGRLRGDGADHPERSGVVHRPRVGRGGPPGHRLGALAGARGRCHQHEPAGG